MSGWGSRLGAARLLCAAASAALASVGAPAQVAPPSPPRDPAEVDPSAPLDALPDLGVAWPELNANDTEPLPIQTPATPGKPKRVVAAGRGDIRYTVQVEGLGGIGNAEELLTAFRKQSALEEDRKDSANAAQIGRRAGADAELLAQLLRSQGYYDAVVEPRTHEGAGQLRVVLGAEPGQQYRFATVELPGLESGGPEAERLRDTFNVKPGDAVIAADVIAGGLALTQALGEQGYAEARIGEQDIEVNHQTRLATLTLPVKPGPVARFGSIRVSGSPPFNARHLATIARFKRGDAFQRSKVDDLRRALIATTLIANADIQVVPVDGGRTVDLNVRLEPAPSHTIAGELGYGTGQGARVEASWTDRNFLNPEGALTLRGIAGTNEQLVGVQFRRGNFMKRDQVLNVQLSASHQEFDAYKANTVLLAANIERQSNFIWHKKWTLSYGGEFL
jgi:translocation and assembly module TamA